MLVKRRVEIEKQDINVTNLIDIAFVLLIVFMITAPMMTQAIKVKTPKVKAENIEIEENIKITIDKDKNIYLDDKRISEDELYNFLKAKLHPRELPILLIADESLPYGFVLKIIGNTRQIGYKQIGFVTTPPKKEENK